MIAPLLLGFTLSPFMITILIAVACVFIILLALLAMLAKFFVSRARHRLGTHRFWPHQSELFGHVSHSHHAPPRVHGHFR